MKSLKRSIEFYKKMFCLFGQITFLCLFFFVISFVESIWQGEPLTKFTILTGLSALVLSLPSIDYYLNFKFLENIFDDVPEIPQHLYYSRKSF